MPAIGYGIGRTASPRDHRTPEERRRDNEELLRALAKVVKPEVFGRIAELFTVGGRITDEGKWIDLLESRLDQETFGDVIEAFLFLPEKGTAP